MYGRVEEAMRKQARNKLLAVEMLLLLQGPAQKRAATLAQAQHA